MLVANVSNLKNKLPENATTLQLPPPPVHRTRLLLLLLLLLLYYYYTFAMFIFRRSRIESESKSNSNVIGHLSWCAGSVDRRWLTELLINNELCRIGRQSQLEGYVARMEDKRYQNTLLYGQIEGIRWINKSRLLLGQKLMEVVRL